MMDCLWFFERGDVREFISVCFPIEEKEDDEKHDEKVQYGEERVFNQQTQLTGHARGEVSQALEEVGLDVHSARAVVDSRPSEDDLRLNMSMHCPD
jgi:hypothetical protein